MSDWHLIYDIGSTYTKLSAFSNDGNKLEFLGKSQSPTSLADIVVGLDQARGDLPLEVRQRTDRPSLFSSSSAAGGLRMVAMGYMPRVTAKAAKEVAMNAGARVLEVVSHDEPADYRLEVIHEDPHRHRPIGDDQGVVNDQIRELGEPVAKIGFRSGECAADDKDRT